MHESDGTFVRLLDGSARLVSKMRRYLKEDQFNQEAQTAFGFLCDHGFFGPELLDDAISFSSGDLGVDVIYDDRDGRVLTIVRAFLSDRNPRAGLACLYVAAGLGPAQDLRDIARTNKQLAGALESQAAALQRLLPVLDGPGRGPLLLGCHGR